MRAPEKAPAAAPLASVAAEREQMARLVMIALGFRPMLLHPDSLMVEEQADGRVTVEWDAVKRDEDGEIVFASHVEVASVRMRSTFTVAHEELAEAVDHG